MTDKIEELSTQEIMQYLHEKIGSISFDLYHMMVSEIDSSFLTVHPTEENKTLLVIPRISNLQDYLSPYNKIL